MKNRNFLRRPFTYSYNRYTIILILLNVLIFYARRIFQNIDIYFPLNSIAIARYKMYWQFVTYMFMHGNLSHLFFNMLGLLIFGTQVEKTIGSKEFLMFYFVTGALSGVLSYLYYYFTGQNATLVGASGLVYAVLYAYAVLYPRSTFFFWGIIPIPAPVLVVIYTVIELGSQIFTVSNVAHYTHLFGFFTAWLYFVVRMGIHPIKVWKNAYK